MEETELKIEGKKKGKTQETVRAGEIKKKREQTKGAKRVVEKTPEK